MPKQVLILDSSQISTYKECDEEYHLRYRENLTQFPEVDEPISAGTYGHKLLEIYYKNLDLGVSQAVKAALSYNIDTHDEADKGHFPLSDDKRKTVRDRFGDYWLKYHDKDFEVIKKPKLQIKVDENGLFKDCMYNQPLVEQGFSVPLLDTPEYLFILEGKVDIIARTQLGISFVDHKFQFRERALYEKSIQFKSYALATGLRTGIINYIRLKKNFDNTTLMRQPIAFNAMEMTYWKQELIEIYIEIAKRIRTGLWKHNWDSCSGKFGYKCEYTSICEEWNPRIKTAIKDVNFKKRKEWKPW